MTIPPPTDEFETLRKLREAVAALKDEVERLREAGERLRRLVDPAHTECKHWREELVIARADLAAEVDRGR